MGRASNERAAKYRWQVFDMKEAGLSAVAFSGSYTDLSNQPTIPPGQVNSDWNSSTGLSQILNKPTLFSGAYADLTGKPTIPAAQVNSDWAASTGVAVILNKPTIPAAQVQTDWNATTGLGVLLNKPTIPTTTTQVAEGTNLYYTNARVAAYLTSVGFKTTETLTGTTGTGGVVNFTFTKTYSTAPHIDITVVGGTASMMLTLTNVTTTGCTVTVVQRSAVTLLGLEVLLAATTGVVGASVSLNVVSR